MRTVPDYPIGGSSFGCVGAIHHWLREIVSAGLGQNLSGFSTPLYRRRRGKRESANLDVGSHETED